MLRFPDVSSRADLLKSGLSRRALIRAVADGLLLRVRRDHYLPGDAPDPLARAIRVGGRLTCLSLLQLLSVFVFANEQTHVHVERGASRLRTDGRHNAGPSTAHARLHWWPLVSPPDPYSPVVDIIDALAHAIRCQPPRHAIATLDSALNKLLITRDQLDEVFRAVPRKYWALRGLIDGRAESGPETLVRLMARSLGCGVELQVQFDGIGRVDLLLDGWLVVECDSREFHADWAAQVNDRRRDAALAARGYSSVRFTAGQIMWQPELVQAALRGLLAARAAG